MFSINLVPEVQQKKQQLAKRNTIATIVAIFILAVCVVALVVMGIIQGVKNSQISNVDEEISRIEGESEQYKELEETVISLEEGLKGIIEINDGNYTWTKMLPHIENATPKDVQFTSLSLEENTLVATLDGENINSLARFVESFKNYQVVSMSGKGNAGEKVNISIDGGTENAVNIKSNGSWTYAINFNPDSDHAITIIQDGQEIRVSYNRDTKELATSEGYEIAASVENLFTSVETNQYKKEGNQVNFDSTISFNKDLVW